MVAALGSEWMPISKAIIPAAGFGTRMLPATKAIPKEMVTVVDKPAIQYVVEEAAAAGAREVLVVTGRGKDAILDHFDRAPELEVALAKRAKYEELESVRQTSGLANMHYIRQPEAKGLGHAVGCGEVFVGGEPFFVLLPDDLIDAEVPCVKQLADCRQSEDEAVIAVQAVPWEDTRRYGVVDVDTATGLVWGIVEKPEPGKAPSNLAVVGRYLLQAEIFACLKDITPGAGGELQLTDAIALLIARGHKVRACAFVGKRYDTGTPLGFIEANLGYARKRRDLRDEVDKPQSSLTRKEPL
ncbi:MAG: UTP--glucose-1-phosphate uridylyltransferase [Dehalococcoidia bacterium]|nr:UTP--glucose-1-phosphate uridylyltransferase [Bacillota bacterium]